MRSPYQAGGFFRRCKRAISVTLKYFYTVSDEVKIRLIIVSLRGESWQSF